jgi:ribosomal protein L2
MVLGRERVSVFLSKSIRRDWSHQRRPDRRQHFLNRNRLPHGQGSLRPSFSSSCLSPWTTRTPRLTCVSDGKPRRRLLIGSKGVILVESLIAVFVSHRSAPVSGALNV